MSPGDGGGHPVMTVPDLEPAARRVVALLDGVPDPYLTAPTPCADTPVAGLLDHLMGLSQAFTRAAHKSTETGGEGSDPGPPHAERLDPNWRALLPKRLGELAEGWRDPMAWSGTAAAGKRAGGALPWTYPGRERANESSRFVASASRCWASRAPRSARWKAAWARA